MSRLDVAHDTAATIADELAHAALAVSMLPLNGTLEELAERRQAIAKRLGEAHVAAKHVVHLLREAR